MKEKRDIPIHKLREKAELGFEIRHHLNGVDERGLESYHYLDKPDNDEFYAHRDDNYFFLLTEGGHASMNVDFNIVRFVEKDIFFVAPGQVHYDVKAEECNYWYVSTATSSIPAEYLEIFENASPFQKPQNMNDDEFDECLCILKLLAGHVRNGSNTLYFQQLSQELLHTFFCIAARRYVRNDTAGTDKVSRPQQISRDFRRLVKENVKSEKSPSRYAAKLNISESYLNEAVKKTTGFTAGYWIRDYVVLEAKRLLFYTEMNIKEIAHALGYEDHTYFSKIFRQTTGTTPLGFRTSYLK